MRFDIWRLLASLNIFSIVIVVLILLGKIFALQMNIIVGNWDIFRFESYFCWLTNLNSMRILKSIGKWIRSIKPIIPRLPSFLNSPIFWAGCNMRSLKSTGDTFHPTSLGLDPTTGGFNLWTFILIAHNFQHDILFQFLFLVLFLTLLAMIFCYEIIHSVLQLWYAIHFLNLL